MFFYALCLPYRLNNKKVFSSMTQTQDETRKQIAEFLPEAIATALTSYQLFLIGDEGNKNAKDFKAHHDACKVAIAHLELLIKLAQWADVPSQGALDEASTRMMGAILSRGQEELDNTEC